MDGKSCVSGDAGESHGPYIPPEDRGDNCWDSSAAPVASQRASGAGIHRQRQVGWIFTDLVSEDTRKGTVRYSRNKDTYFLSSEECITAGDFQNKHPNMCRLSPDGHFGSKFVTAVATVFLEALMEWRLGEEDIVDCVEGEAMEELGSNVCLQLCGDTSTSTLRRLVASALCGGHLGFSGPDNQVHFEGYQVSNQCMALVRDECLLPCKDAPELGYAKESSSEQYVPDVFYKSLCQTLISQNSPPAGGERGTFHLSAAVPFAGDLPYLENIGLSKENCKSKHRSNPFSPPMDFAVEGGWLWLTTRQPQEAAAMKAHVQAPEPSWLGLSSLLPITQ
ncbi:hypothetical protein P7K49_012102 [Saguinus oedipus]|uniref:Nuclear pore localisation protein NPL4 C-terminal domain-containing protein n=1 Tax=Saguinus oedipus TaxID=9490 RepID=A0ABQ9VSK1_SAGOE|nr:hypothetical protein P7K49_012102 [Saguinus oedipus]